MDQKDPSKLLQTLDSAIEAAGKLARRRVDALAFEVYLWVADRRRVVTPVFAAKPQRATA